MPAVDLDYGIPGAAAPIPAYTPPAPVSTGASPLPAPNPILSPQHADLGTTIQQALLNSPTFKQQNEWNTDDTKLALDRLAEDKKFYEQNYQLALQSLRSAGGGGSSGEAQAAALDKLAKEQAAHQTELSREAIRESRGVRTGQQAFEQGELQYNYENLLKEIDLRAEARRAAAASANAAASRNRASQLASMQLQYAQDMVKFGRNEQDIRTGSAREAGKILMSSGERLAAAWWNDDTSEYEGPGGERWDRFGNPVDPTAAASAVTYTPPSVTTSDPIQNLYNASQIRDRY